MSGVFHNQAGDLHTPGMGFGLGTPLSISHSETHTNSASAIDMHAFHPHLLQSQPYQSSNPFAQQQTYAPSSFVHQDSGYETIPGIHNASSENMEATQDQSHFTGFAAQTLDTFPSQPNHIQEK